PLIVLVGLMVAVFSIVQNGLGGAHSCSDVRWNRPSAARLSDSFVLNLRGIAGRGRRRSIGRLVLGDAAHCQQGAAKRGESEEVFVHDEILSSFWLCGLHDSPCRD